ncbi:GGDEF domain-containing protein [Demequina sp. NBRC 110051]|uniref:GGDEF domain-containing protein n=1 Tax=Demequina sp. NBRC 110051 TaxID=1570340 RepID=UPI000A04BDD5|nr:GGDEF domain-containing protein [Demequina sp. NBRC 110051]
MLDLDTLRFVQACVGVLTFVLVFFGTYLPSRAPYAGWWSLVVVASSVSTAFYGLTGTSWGWLTDAVGHALAVLAAAFAWVAARSLRHLATRPLAVAAAPVAVLVAAAVLPRHEGVLAGTLALLIGMAIMFGLAAYQLWTLATDHGRAPGGGAGVGTHHAVVSVALAASAMALLYAIRAVVFVLLGPLDPWYVTWTGPAITTIVVTLAMVVVTYSVTELSRFEISERWRRRAMRDDLTDLLHRTPFMDQGRAILASPARGAAPYVVAADFDHFKELNDAHGHAEGDRVLRAFGHACRALLADRDLACRLGGEEFALLLAATDADAVVALTSEISAAVRRDSGPDQQAATISFGIAAAHPGERLEDAMERADRALYEAKAAGRDRAVVHADDLPQAGA